MSQKKGFTLIELLVVIAIIGILSSVVLASLNSARLKSRDARRVSDLKQLQLALELYYDANSSNYPATLSLLAPTYIARIPNDPQTAVAYPYYANGSGTTCSSYHLLATLEQTTGSVALANDADAALAAVCTGSATPDVAGTDPLYDVKP